MNASPKVYLARAGSDGEDEADALLLGVAIIGFTEYPSLADAKDYDAVLALVQAARPDLTSRAAGNDAGQLWAFAGAMQPGDLVVLPRKQTSQVALGRVVGPYAFQQVGSHRRHVRAVEWVRRDVPRSVFGQDLLHAFSTFMAVCNIQRNDAESRVAAVLAGKPDPGCVPVPGKPRKPDSEAAETAQGHDLALIANDQILAHIQRRFHGHALAKLVNAVLEADGWTTTLWPGGADAPIAIVAGRGPFGLDAPRLFVHVISRNSPADWNEIRTVFARPTASATEQWLVVCWGGFSGPFLSKGTNAELCLWDSRDLVEAICRTYGKLPVELQADLPLKRVWMLVQDGKDA